MKLKLLCAGDPHLFHCARQISVLTKAGVEVRLVDHGINFLRGSTSAASHVRWPRSGRRTLTRLLGQALADAIADQLISFQLRWIWRKWQTEVCHVHWVDDRTLSAVKAGLRPLVVTAYGSDMNGTRLPSYDPLLLQQVKEGLAQVDLFIADSEDLIQLAEELAGRKLPCLLLPIGVDTNLFKPGYQEEAKAWRAELNIPAQAHVVLSARLIGSNYRHIELVQSFAHALRAHHFDGYMIFKTFLSDMNYVDQLRRATREMGVAERIRIIDGVPYERLPVLYAMANLVVSYPILDAFPVTFLEASACEVPILTHHLIAYDSNGMPEFLNFMEGEDAGSIGALMAGLTVDAKAKEKARVARRHVVSNYDESCFSGALLDAYERASNRSPQMTGSKNSGVPDCPAVSDW
jgi:glycosyltransferase involved in cell wall biosynthesis